MSEEPKHSYTALEIVEEFFPATPARLVPRDLTYRLERSVDGDVRVMDAEGTERLRMTPVEGSGDEAAHLCCDLCHTSSPRDRLHLMRSEVPGSSGRRFRYLMACRDTDACEARRLDDGPVEILLRAR